MKFLRAAEELLGPNAPPEIKAALIELMKHAASCSRIQQACDVSKSFLITRQMANIDHGFPDAPYTKHLESILKECDAASRRTFIAFLRQAVYIFDKAFAAPIIQQGWKTAGIVPFNPDTILQRCTSYSKMTADQGKCLRDMIPAVIAEASVTGEVSDKFMQDQAGDRLNFDAWRKQQHDMKLKRTPKPHHLRVLNQRRCVWVNHEAVTTRARVQAAEEKARAAAAQAKKAAGASKKAAAAAAAAASATAAAAQPIVPAPAARKRKAATPAPSAAVAPAKAPRRSAVRYPQYTVAVPA